MRPSCSALCPASRSAIWVRTNSAPDFSQVQVGQPTPYASNGAPVAGITLKLDGANLTDAGNFGANLQNINDSFVSEVQVQTSNFGADQSNGPVVITGVTKSGTSKYHGSLYTFARTYQLNANDWLANYNGIARPDDRFVYPGGTISGPFPHFKKLTFFAGAEYDAQRNVYAYGSAGSAIIHALVPTQAMRTGDFSAGGALAVPRADVDQRQLRHVQHAADGWRQRLDADQRQHRRVSQPRRDGAGQRHPAASDAGADWHRRLQLRRTRPGQQQRQPVCRPRGLQHQPAQRVLCTLQL